jgi:hypothetical protein
MLPLATIRRELDRLPIRTMERLIHIQHRLHRIVPGRHILQTPNRIPCRRVSNTNALPRLHPIHGYAKHHLALRSIVNLHPRLSRSIIR